jgi:ABC-2 type transport system permease protein
MTTSYREEVVMSALVRTELLALRTIRMPWALVVTAVVITGALAIDPVVDAGKAGAPSIGTAGALLAVLGSVGRGSLVVLVLGVLAVTAEFRHGTASATFLGTAQRPRVLVAKGAAVMLVGMAVAVANLAVASTVGLAAGAVQPSLLNPDIVLRVLGLLLAYPLYGLFGVGVAALIVYQPVAVLLPLAWVLYLEEFALHLLPHAIGPWSAGGALAALSNAGDFTDVLPMAIGGVLLAGYALVLLSLGAVRVVHRDIT